MKTETMKIRTITAEELLKLLKIDPKKEELSYLWVGFEGEVEIKTKVKK